MARYRGLPRFRSGRRWKQVLAIVSYTILTLMLLLVALGIAYAAANPPPRDQSGKVTVVHNFIAALNAHHSDAALRLTTPDFAVVDATGANVTGSAGVARLVVLGTPIRIISLTPRATEVTGVLRFGSGAPTAVTFVGRASAGRIFRLRLGTP